MKTIEDLNKELQAEKKKIAALEAEIQLLSQQSKYPKSKWLELWKYDGEVLLINGIFFDKKYLIFAALVETCKEWNKIDKFKANWTNGAQDKYVISSERNDFKIYNVGLATMALYFKTRETAQLFIDTYRAELEQVKDLL